LYYRLNVVSISLPPLRDRQEEIPALIEHFTARYCNEMKRPLLAIDPGAMEMLRTYRWPGNVRELQNVIERAVVLSPGPAITGADFPLELRAQGSENGELALHGQTIDPALPLAAAMEAFKRIRVRQALEAVNGNQTKAAQVLGLPRPNLSRLMKQLGLR
jgi:DNA-binding NtrC family response regulator